MARCPTPGGLALPAAQPSMAWMYSLRGVFISDEYVVVADSGNHRVLIWHGLPQADEQPADVVLGQPDGQTEGPAAAGRGPERRNASSTGAGPRRPADRGDAQHHRILVWNSVPQSSDTAPDVVLSQPDSSHRCGRTAAASARLRGSTGRSASRSSGRRSGSPTPATGGFSAGPAVFPNPTNPPTSCSASPTPVRMPENREGPAAGDSFRWPWPHRSRRSAARRRRRRPPGSGLVPTAAADRPADLVIGHPTSPAPRNGPTGHIRMTGCGFPYAVCLDGQTLAVADTANNRILLWDGMPDGPLARADGPDDGPSLRGADHVLAQPDFRIQRREPLDLRAARHPVLALRAVAARRHPGRRGLRQQPGDAVAAG